MMKMWGLLMSWFARLAILSLLASGLTDCTHYQLQTALDPDQPIQPAAPTVPPNIQPTDYYVRVIANAQPASGQSANSVCSRPFWLPYVENKNDTVSVSAVLSGGSGTNTTTIPLFTVSSDTSTNTCNIEYDERYLLPSSVFVSGEHLSISSLDVYQTTGSLLMGEYLNDATNLESFLAPSGAPVIAKAADVLSSSAAQDVQNQLNNKGLSSDQRSMIPVMSFDFGLPNPTITQSKRYIINQVPLDLSNNPQQDKAQALGEVTITSTQLLTVLGDNPGPGQTYPSYGNLQLYSQFLIFPYQTPQQIYGLVNTGTNLNRASVVQTLQINAQTGDISTACGALKNALAQLGLNRLDQLAYLFLVYSSSPYAQAHEIANIKNMNSPCLAYDDLTLAKAMNLPQLWLPPTS